MTDHRYRPAAFLIAFCMALGTAHAQSVDAPASTTGNSFNAPGYPDANAQRNTTQGNQTGAGAGRGTQLDPSNQRGLNTTINGGGRPGAPNPTADGSQRRANLVPPKPSEFQKFVEAATGRLLPIFGSNFFVDAADSFAPVDNVPVSSDYVVGPGDEIVLRAWGSIDVDYRSTVDRNGLLNLPKIGSFNVAGVKASELEKHLQMQIGRLYTNFSLSASLGQLRGVKVSVVGPAQRPGVYTLASQSTMLSAVVMAGGPSPSGSMRKVQLRRDGRVISELDIYQFLVQGDKSKDLQLAAGDVVVLLPVGPRVAITGALDTPAIFELKTSQEPLQELLRYAGGLPTLANPNKAQLERVDAAQPTAARSVETFAIDAQGLQKSLRDGDVLTLLPISPQFANAVTLRGHVALPLRYPFKPGMRIRDLIPDRDALISPDFYRRKNLLVQVLEDDDDDVRFDRNNITGGNVDPNAAIPNSNNPNNGTVTAGFNGSNASSAAAATRAGAAAITPSANAQRTRTERQRRREDRDLVEASRKAPTALFDELNWDYAVIERLNTKDLSTQVIPFNLGKAVLQNDEANNIELMPGDVVTVYSQKDIRVPVSRQTRLVSLEGEVASPGVYQLQPGDTLQSLLQRAGGFTPQAYIYGMEFSREETRQRQRENIAAAIVRLETLSSVQAARDAANRRDDAVAAATTVAVSNAATQAQLSRLRAVQPNGRIALELDPETVTLDALPPVPLEAGDRIVVPSRPGFVTVAGAVVNSNAFLWKPGRTAGEYLRMAGADEAAEPDNMFILRADGTVSHANDRRSFFGRNKLESQVMQPGDALIVPNQLDFETWGRATIRNLKDFAQIFSGFGIGIAAINSIKN